MNRNSGLVQRRNVAQSSTPGNTEIPTEDNDKEELGDSKETRLTLMEEILLLGLKDREVFLIVKYCGKNYNILHIIF